MIAATELAGPGPGFVLVPRAGLRHTAGMEHPEKAVQQHMHATEAAIHAVMIICTLGLWYPVYRHRRNKLARTVKYR